MRLGCDVIDQRQETAVGIARLLGAGAERRGWCVTGREFVDPSGGGAFFLCCARTSSKVLLW